MQTSITTGQSKNFGTHLEEVANKGLRELDEISEIRVLTGGAV